MKKKRLLLTGSVVLLAILSAALYYSFFYVASVSFIGVDLEVDRVYAFNLDPDMVHLGAAMPGGSAYRAFFVANHHEFPVRIALKKSGKLAGWFSLNVSEIDLEPRENATVRVFAKVPDSAKYGNYTATIRAVAFRR